ncbi:energy-coupling factor transporter transmembrane protein EcfT [bacterium]|nr:energy-coupling factor transporter transmembrane protein EcfT [bacterium]
MSEACRAAEPAAVGHARARATGGRAVQRGLAAIGLALAAQLAPTQADGWLAGFDARAKLIGVGLLIVAVSLLHTLPTVAAAAGLAVALALAAGLRGRRLTPLWLGVPLFTLALALPSCLNLITPGPALWVLWGHTPREIAVTAPGLVVAARFFLRTLACVALALTLTGTSASAALIVGLRRLGLPRVFGTVLTMMQRYLVLVLRQAEELHLARLSRGYGGETVRQGQHWAAAGMGITLLSSLRLAEAVHDAMTARGYDGDIQTLRPPRWRKRERALVVVGLVVAAALVAWDGWLR